MPEGKGGEKGKGKDAKGSTSAAGVGYLFLIISTAYLGSVIMGYSCLFLVVYPPLFHKVIGFVQQKWLCIAGLVIEMRGVKIVLSGDGIPSDPSEVFFMISNHRTRIDWLILWAWVARVGLAALGRLKIILKDSLRMIPFFGWAMQTMMFIFLARKWETDEDYFRKMMGYFGTHLPSSVLIFPEGTDLAPQMQERDNAYCEKKGLKKYNYVLHPRTLGFLTAYKALQPSIDAVYDLTLGYEDSDFGNRPNESDLWKNSLPKVLHIHTRRIKVADMPTTDEGLEKFIVDSFEQKEKVLKEFYAMDKPSFGPYKGGAKDAKQETPIGQLVLSCAFFFLLYSAWAYLMWSSGWFRIFMLLIATFHIGFYVAVSKENLLQKAILEKGGAYYQAQKEKKES